MNSNCAGSRAKVSLALGFKNTRKEDSYLKSATPKNLALPLFEYTNWYKKKRTTKPETTGY
jgi:hypothetical protein